MTATVQVERVQWFKDQDEASRHGVRGADGAVWYLILEPCTHEPRCEIACVPHAGHHHAYGRQAFARGGRRHAEGASREDVAQDRANIWGVTGEGDDVTTDPSFLCRWPLGEGKEFRLHSYMRKGRLDVLSDSNVALHPAPVPCRDPVQAQAEGL